MGIEIIRLGDKREQIDGPGSLPNLAELTFQTHEVSAPPMAIWMMSAGIGRPILPWWNYDARIDDEVNKLSQDWGITSAQGLFDCLYLSQLKKTAGPNFYVIFPGNLKIEGWDKVKETDQMVYSRGQACVYHLEGSFNGQLSINWVPFFQPQSIIRDPSFGTLWRLFVAARTDDVTNSISFFSLADTKQLPKAVQLLINKNDERSETLSHYVDWFGMYSSPIDDRYASCGITYGARAAALARFSDFERQFKAAVDQARQQLAAHAHPQTALKILTRQIAL